MTSKGIYTNLFLVAADHTGNIYQACLACTVHPLSSDSPAIYLRRTSTLRTTFEKQNEYTRIIPSRLDVLGGTEKEFGEHKEVYVRKLDDVRLGRVQEYRNVNVFWISIGSCRVYPEEQWNPQSEMFFSQNTADGKMGVVYCRSLPTPILITFGISPTGQPWCHATATTLPEYSIDWESYELPPKRFAASHLDLNNSKATVGFPSPLPAQRERVYLATNKLKSTGVRFSVFAEVREHIVYSTAVYRVEATATNEDTGESFDL